MDAQELRDRTKKFAVRILRLFTALPKTSDAQAVGKQLVRSGTSVAANYRAACRARSHAEFVSRIGVVAEEADETVFWLELLVDADLMTGDRLQGLVEEAKELTAIFSSSRQTARRRKQ